MPWYETALLGGAIIAAILAWNVPRAVLWIGLGALSFVSSSWWANSGFPYPPAFGAFTDFLVAFAIYAYAQRKWEDLIRYTFLLMILIDWVYLAGGIGSHYVYATALELVNWAALVVISVTGIMDRVRGGNGQLYPRRSHSGALAFLHRVLRSPRTPRPFWK